MNNETLRRLREAMGLAAAYESPVNAAVPESSMASGNSQKSSRAKEENVFSSENSKTLAEKINSFDMPEPKEAVKGSMRIGENPGLRQLYGIISRGDSRNEMMISALSTKFGRVWEPILLESLIENIDAQEIKKILPSCKSPKELILYDLYLGLKRKSTPENGITGTENYDKTTYLDIYNMIPSILASQKFSSANPEPERANENPNYIMPASMLYSMLKNVEEKIGLNRVKSREDVKAAVLIEELFKNDSPSSKKALEKIAASELGFMELASKFSSIYTAVCRNESSIRKIRALISEISALDPEELMKKGDYKSCLLLAQRIKKADEEIIQAESESAIKNPELSEDESRIKELSEELQRKISWKGEKTAEELERRLDEAQGSYLKKTGKIDEDFAYAKNANDIFSSAKGIYEIIKGMENSSEKTQVTARNGILRISGLEQEIKSAFEKYSGIRQKSEQLKKEANEINKKRKGLKSIEFIIKGGKETYCSWEELIISIKKFRKEYGAISDPLEKKYLDAEGLSNALTSADSIISNMKKEIDDKIMSSAKYAEKYSANFEKANFFNSMFKGGVNKIKSEAAESMKDYVNQTESARKLKIEIEKD